MFLKAQYQEDRVEGMTTGPLDSDVALVHSLGVPEARLSYDAQAVRGEAGGTKKPPLDGSITDANFPPGPLRLRGVAA